MQEWIHLVSWSLYFWKSVFRFRTDSILKLDGNFISNWKFLDCVHFFGVRARQGVIETIAVVYELTKRTQEMCSPIGHNNTKHFLCPIRSRNGPVRVGTQGLFHPYLKTFVLPFLPTRLTAPGSPRTILGLCHCIFTDQYIFETLIFYWRALFISKMWAPLHLWAYSKHKMGKEKLKAPN